MGPNNTGFKYLCYPPETDKDARKETKQDVYKNLAKFLFSIFFFFLVLSACYNWGYNEGYRSGYSDGTVTGYITNKYITHDYAVFSEVNATNEENFLKKLHEGAASNDNT